MAAMAVPAASPAGCGDVSIQMPSAAAAAAPARDVEGGAAANNDNPEKHLSRFVRCVAFGEWAGNAFGALAFVWATGVLLGGFCSSLNRQDFWFATVMIFIQAFRIFSRGYKLDSQSLFGTARALWINSSLIRMLLRPQEGNRVVLVVVLWLNLLRETACFTVIPHFVLAMAFLVPWSRRPRRPPQWQIWSAAIAYLLFAAYTFAGLVLSAFSVTHRRDHYSSSSQPMPFFFFSVLPILIEAAAVLLQLNLRRLRGFTNLIIATPPLRGRKLISLAKVTSALWLAAEHLLLVCPLNRSTKITLFVYSSAFSAPFAILVLSLGSLQSHGDTSVLGRCADAVLHVTCLCHFLLSLPMAVSIDLFVAGLYPLPAAGLSFVLLLVLLLIGNLQIPAAVVQAVLSSLRLSNLLREPRVDYSPLPASTSPNLVAAIAVFYLLALCQGSLYIMASVLALFSSFPRRWLMRRSKFVGGGKLLGAKAIDLYYQRAYATVMEMGVFGTGSTMSFADFAIESLSSSSSSSRDLHVAGLCVLHNILLERRTDDCNTTQDLILRVTGGSSGIAVSSTLISMLAWAADDGYAIRLLAARVTAELASSLRISSIPGMLKLVSSLLNLAENTNIAVVLVPNQQQRPGPQQTPFAIANGVGSNRGQWRSWVVCQFLQRMKQDYWSITEEPATATLSLPHQQSSSLPMLGMVILEKLARDLDNCAEIFRDDTSNLISKAIGLIGLTTTSDNEQHDALVCSSLEFLRRLATTGERIGVALRHELWNHPFLLTCLARVLEDDNRSSTSPHQVWEPAMDILAKLALLDKQAGLEIGKIQVITARLLHAFFGRQGSTNMYYEQSLRKVSGEALANLALWGTTNCSAILDEPGHQVIDEITNMLFDDDHNRHVAASLLLNICEQCSVNLLMSHPHATERLSSAVTTVVKHMIDAEGKQLESLINLASEIGDVTREAFVHELESQTKSGAELVQKLICTLNSKKIPNPEYPRMRRVIVKIMISILESCRGTVEKLMEEGVMEQLMESLTKIERTPSRVEEYRVFYGNIGVIPEDGEPMATLVARAKMLLVRRTTQSAGAPTGNHL